jgi:hypothetical protein
MWLIIVASTLKFPLQNNNISGGITSPATPAQAK